MCRVLVFFLPLVFMNFMLIKEIESCTNFMNFYHYDVNYACNSDEISATILFKQPFNGIVFAKNYYADPSCSSPNMYIKPTSEIQLVLPLLQCGTKVRRSRGRRLPRIRNTLVIQFNPILKSINDSEVPMTCSPCEPLSSEFWELYLQRDRNLKPKVYIRMTFEPGRNVLSENIAGRLRVSNEMFLVIYADDNYEYNDFHVRKCWAHNESIVNETTSVVLLSEMQACKRTLLGNITLERKNKELVRFTRVNNFNIVAKGNLYVSCALDFCKETCPNLCSRESNRWSFVGTHKVFKRSTDEFDPKRNEINTRNDLLKSRIRALAERFFKLRLQMIAKTDSNGSQTALKSFTQAPIETENEVWVDSFTANIKPNSDADFTRRNIRSQEWMNSEKNDSEALSQTETPTTQDLESNCSDSFCTTSDDSLKTKIVENSNLVNASTEIVMQMNRTYISDEDVDIDKNTSSATNNVTQVVGNTVLLSSTKTESDCVPQLKFVTVTVTLSLLTIFMFLICVGVLIHSRKESKRQKLDSYFLFSSF